MSELQDKLSKVTVQHALAIGIVLAALYYFNYYDGGEQVGKQITTKKQELVKAQQELSSIESLVADFDKYQNEITSLSTKFEEAIKFLPSQENIYVIIKQLYLEARKSGVNITLMKPATQNIKKDFYEELPFVIEAEGGFIQMLTFLGHVVNLPRIINIMNVELSGDGKNVLNPSIKFKGDFNAYRFIDNPELTEKKQ